MNIEGTEDSVDVLLILEGTYPYVRGGVSSWINRLITGFPDVRFGVVFLGSARADYGKHAYTLGVNVVHYEEHFLYAPAPPPASRGPGVDRERIRQLHAGLRAATGDGAMIPMDALASNIGVTEEEFLSARNAWELILEGYEGISEKPAFIDYFWAVRGMHAPLWVLQRILERAPSARIFHSASTGYAGYVGALLSHRHGGRLILSEHGIYTKERRIDLMLASWIGACKASFRSAGGADHIRQLWIRFFETMARVAYRQATDVVNLYAGACALQSKDGANPATLRTIPNGIAIAEFATARRPLAERRDVIALIGRIVRIKDIKTFIRAAGILVAQVPHMEAWIVGPDTEDPEYRAECQDLIDHLQIGGRVKLLGHRSTVEVLCDIRLAVLSSISEGLPLTILESFAAGVPVVATDVGACRELILGASPEDAALGPAGSVVPIANAAALAGAIRAILSEPPLWHAMSGAATARVERYYTESRMFAAYRSLYRFDAESA